VQVTLFLAQNHSAMTHLPIATAILGAVAAIAALYVHKNEITWTWAVLSIAAFVTALPAAVTGIAAAKGRFNDEGKPYIQSGLIVAHIPANTRIFRHQILGASGSAVAAILAILGLRRLRGQNPNRYLVVLLAVLLAILWGIGGHLGGRELWGPDTFPGFH
jgi:hypothetical protein